MCSFFTVLKKINIYHLLSKRVANKKSIEQRLETNIAKKIFITNKKGRWPMLMLIHMRDCNNEQKGEKKKKKKKNEKKKKKHSLTNYNYFYFFSYIDKDYSAASRSVI